MIKDLETLFLNNYLLPPTITGGLPPSEPGKPGTTCVLPSHLSRNNLKVLDRRDFYLMSHI